MESFSVIETNIENIYFFDLVVKDSIFFFIPTQNVGIVTLAAERLRGWKCQSIHQFDLDWNISTTVWWNKTAPNDLDRILGHSHEVFGTTLPIIWELCGM